MQRVSFRLLFVLTRYCHQGEPNSFDSTWDEAVGFLSSVLDSNKNWKIKRCHKNNQKDVDMAIS